MTISSNRKGDAEGISGRREQQEESRSGFLEACLRIGAVPRYRICLLQGLFALLAIALMLFSTWQWPLPLDPEVQAANGGWLYRAMDIVSWPGFAPWNAVMVVVVAIIVALWLGWRHGLYLLLLTLFQGLVALLLKIVIPTERPAEVDVNAPVEAINNAFPSGHVLLFVVFFGFLFYLVATRLHRSLLPFLLLGLFTTMVRCMSECWELVGTLGTLRVNEASYEFP
jgi:membrane-associated phospholipid phosphatase